ncbi:MAG: hypothetical protein HY238_01360 [Acidobacteria bacterium]|nr:hypothetical protein [Acidobacteriota bacterium]
MERGSWIVGPLIAALALAGCQGDVAVHPPDKQQAVHRPEPLGPFVQMNQPDAERYFVSGVYGLEAATWRWCGRQAVLRVRLKGTEDLRYVMKFAVVREVIARRGPMNLRVLFNDKPWKSWHYEKDGIYEVEEPAPANLLKPEADNLVTIETDKTLPSDGKGPELGFILVHAGFRP